MKDNFLTDSFITPAGRLSAQELCTLLPASISLVLEVLSSVKTGNLGKYLGAQPGPRLTPMLHALTQIS